MNTKHYILLMAAALAMAGCAFDDPMERQKPWEESDSDLPKPVTFSVSTANNVDFTRADTCIVTFDKDEQIRVLVRPTGSDEYTPYDYTTADKGQSVALTAPDPQPYFPAGVRTTVDAYAYYPATASTGGNVPFTVADYQRDNADYKASDLMMAVNRTITKDVDDGKNSLTMKHLMALIRVKAVPDSASDLKITKIQVVAKRSVFFTPEAETVTETTGNADTITVLNTTDLMGAKGGEGYILIPPQLINGVTVRVVTGGGTTREIATYGFTADGSFEAGGSYGVNITVTPEQLGFTTAIANWNGMGSVLIAPSGDLIIDPIEAKPYLHGTPVTLTTEDSIDALDATRTIPAQLRVRKGGNVLKAGLHYSVKYLNNVNVGKAYVVVMGLSGTDPGSGKPFDYTSSVGVAPFSITSAKATISYGDVTKVTKTYLDEDFTTPIFNGGDGIVTYRSSADTIATVNAATGEVHIVKPGTATIIATVADGANYIYDNSARTASYTLVVNKAPGAFHFDDTEPTVTWNKQTSKNYFTQSVVHDKGNGKVTYTIPATTSEDNTCGATIEGSTIGFTKAGKVVVTATAADNDYYTYDEVHRTAAYTLTVEKALGTCDLSAYSGHVPYNKTETLFDIEKTHDGGTVNVTSANPAIATVTESGGHVHVHGVKAGSTTITVTCSETSRYQEAKAEFTVYVDQIAITGVKAPTAKDLTYTGDSLALVTTGSADFGTVKYSLDQSTWSTSVPKGTDAVTYQVYWQVEGDNDHSTYTPEGPVSVTIKKANPTYTAPTASTLTYNGHSQQLVTGGSTGHGTIQFSRDGSSGWTTTVPTETNAGNYTVYWKLVGDSNHNDVDPTPVSNVRIAQGSVTYTAPAAQDLTYTGSALALLSAGSVDANGTISYSKNGTNWSSSVPTETDAGTYTVYYKVDGKTANYKGLEAQSVSVTIKKATPTVTAPTAKSLSYNGTTNSDGTPQNLVNAGSTTGGTLQYSLNNSSWSTTVPQGTNHATYTVYYKVVGNNNYNDVAAKSVSVTIAKGTGHTLTLSPTSGSVMAGNSISFTVKNNTSGGTLSVSSDNSRATASISNNTVTVTTNGTTAANATITVTSAETTNLQAKSANYTLTINSQDPGIALANASVGYKVGSTGKAYAPNTTMPSGTTLVGVIAYKSGSSGYVVKAADSPKTPWSKVSSYCTSAGSFYVSNLSSKTNKTWKCGNKTEWDNIFKSTAYGGSGGMSGLETYLLAVGGSGFQHTAHIGGTDYSGYYFVDSQTHSTAGHDLFYWDYNQGANTLSCSTWTGNDTYYWGLRLLFTF